jgi:hypothetical protein
MEPMFTLSSFAIEEHRFTAVILIVNISAAFFIYWLLNHSRLSSWLNASKDIAPSFLSISALLFGLFVTNLASDVWTRHSDANLILINETSAIRSLLSTAKNLGSSEELKLNTAVKNYVNAVLTKEWPAMADGDDENRGTAETEFEALSQTTIQIYLQAKDRRGIESHLMPPIDNIRTARLKRLSLAHDDISFVKWRSVGTFSLLLLLSVGIVHLRSQRAMIITFAIAIICILASELILFNNKSPYQGRDPIKPGMLAESIKAI